MVTEALRISESLDKHVLMFGAISAGKLRRPITGFISLEIEGHASSQQNIFKTTLNVESGALAGSKYVKTINTFPNPFKLFQLTKELKRAGR